MMGKVIAIDGPAGSGKGTVAKLIADRLNYIYIDSGATYRSVALFILENCIDYKDEGKVLEIAKSLDIKFDENGKTFLNGIDVSDRIRSKEVSELVSLVSSNIKLREILVDIQRNMAGDRNVVMDGRDITTVVFPDADYKFYLDADIFVRAKRRYKENTLKGIENSSYNWMCIESLCFFLLANPFGLYSIQL